MATMVVGLRQLFPEHPPLATEWIHKRKRLETFAYRLHQYLVIISQIPLQKT